MTSRRQCHDDLTILRQIATRPCPPGKPVPKTLSQRPTLPPPWLDYRSLVQQFPSVSQLWAELGVAAAGDLDLALADQAFQRALELAPADASMLVSIGAQYFRLRRLDQAFACLKRAVAADPLSAKTRLILASWLERSRRLDEASEYVEAGLAQQPNDGQMLYFKAFLLHRKGLNTETETALRHLLKNALLLSPEVQSNA